MAGVAKVRGVFCAESRDWFGGLGILSVYVVLGGSVRGVCVYCLGGGGLGGHVRGVVLQSIVFFLVWAGPPRRGPPPHPVTYLLKSSYSIANLLY